MTLAILGLGHVGYRVADRARSLAFYAALGFEETAWHEGPRVAVLRNAHGVELNLIVNATDANEGKNILMDVERKYAGITHVAFRVTSIEQTVHDLAEAGVAVTEGPVRLGVGYTALFIRDPDRNVIELGCPTP